MIDPKLLRTSRIEMGTPVTTIERIVLNRNPSLPPATGRSAIAKESNVTAMFTNNAATTAHVGGVPPPAPLMYVSDDFQPAAGVYILCAPSAAGKTILSCGLAAWANSSGTPSTYISCFEPRSQLGRDDKYKWWQRPAQFISDAEGSLTRGKGKKLIIYDSATLPMKAYASKDEFANQATFSGGSQPSDRGFLDAMSKLAASHQACLVVVLNSSLIPYVADLHGAVEGIINIKDVGSFTYRDRTTFSARKEISVIIPLEFVNAALKANYFGEYQGSRKAVPGLNTRAGMYSNRNK